MQKTTREEVFAAASELEASGEKVSQRTVRAHMGGGSYATIGPILKEWQEKREGTAKAAEIVMPEVVAERFSTACKSLWNEAVAEAQKGVETERQSLAAEQARAKEAVTEAEAIVADLESEAAERDAVIETQKADLAASRQEAEAAAKRAAEAENEVSRLTEKASGLQLRLSDATQSIEKLEAQVQVERQQAQSERQRADAAEKRADKAEYRVESESQRASAAEASAKSEAERASRAEQLLAKSHSDIAVYESKIEHFESAGADKDCRIAELERHTREEPQRMAKLHEGYRAEIAKLEQQLRVAEKAAQEVAVAKKHQYKAPKQG